jgi:hypothetical protein
MLCLLVMTAIVSLAHTIPNVGIYVSIAVTFILFAVTSADSCHISTHSHVAGR